ncbi:DUF4439 domain-containing protein [Kineococcus sp. SYSU DK004]|uniref:DUF4439 domain-containing protein n=1 Tax=Kineococcus sp. SYSU DK004 TaxID=3383125 RepID=UPI003D7DC15A
MRAAPPPVPGGAAAGGPHRRAVLTAGLGAGLAAGAVLLGGCGVRWVTGPEPTPTPARGPDDDARDTAVADARALAAVRADPAAAEGVRAVLVDVAAAAAEHLSALGADDDRAEPTTGPASDPSTGPTTGSAVEVLDEPARVLEVLATATADVPAVVGPLSGGMARLLAAVAVSRRLHAERLAAALGAPLEPPAPAGPGEAARAVAAEAAALTGVPAADGAGPAGALQDALAGAHAAVHAHGLVAGRVLPATDEAVHRAALAAADAHRVVRDALAELLSARGLEPVAAAPAYDLPAPAPGDVAAARDLARRVELGLVDVWSAGVAATRAERALAAAGCLAAARAAASWGAPLPALPGLGDSGPP